MDWEDKHQTCNVLETGIGTSVGVMFKGDFGFISILKIRFLVLFVICKFFFIDDSFHTLPLY